MSDSSTSQPPPASPPQAAPVEPYSGEGNVGMKSYVPSTRNLIVSIIATLWGAAIVSNGLLGEQTSANSSYAAGQRFAVIFGAILLIAGLRTVIRETRARS